VFPCLRVSVSEFSRLGDRLRVFFTRPGERRSQQAGGNIASHVTTDAWRDQHARGRVNVEAHFNGPQALRLIDRRRVRFQPDILGGKPEQQVRHRGVAGHDDVGDLPRPAAMLLAESDNQTVECVQHQPPHLFKPLGRAGVVDPADDVRPTGKLAVVVGSGAEQSVAGQVDETDRTGRRTHVNGQAKLSIGGVAGFDAQDLRVFLSDRQGHFPVALP